MPASGPKLHQLKLVLPVRLVDLPCSIDLSIDLNFHLLCSEDSIEFIDSGTSGSRLDPGGTFDLNSGNLWLDAMAGELAHVSIDPRNLIQNSQEKVKLDESNPDLASLVLVADGQLQTLHRQTREARARELDSSNLSPEYKRKLEATLEQVFVLSRSLVADVGHQAVEVLTELKTLKDQNILLVDQVSNVEGKVDGLVIKASAEPRPEHLHPDLVKSLSGFTQGLSELKHRVDSLAKQPPGVHPDLVKRLADLKRHVEGLAQCQPLPDQPLHPDLIESLSDLKSQVEGLAKQPPLPDQHLHPDLIKRLSDLKQKVDGLVVHQPPAHPDLIKQLSDLSEQHRLSNHSLAQQVATLSDQHQTANADLVKKLNQVEQALKDSTDSDRLDECIRETVGKPIFLQWMEWMRNLWYKDVPKHSHFWHPLASKGSTIASK